MNELTTKDSINKFCPRSYKKIINEALSVYSGFVVGFCNANCRDDFNKDSNKAILDKQYFDSIIIENNLSQNKETNQTKQTNNA